MFTSRFFTRTSTAMLILILTLNSVQTVYAAAPTNDNFDNPTVIGALPFSDSVDVTDATFENNEPNYCAPSQQTIWYSFTPATSGVIRAQIETDTANAVLTIYRASGPGFESLFPLTCGLVGEILSAEVHAGDTYYLQAGHMNGGNGVLSINLHAVLPPANDNFANAETIGLPLPFHGPADSAGATLEEGEPLSSCGFETLGKTVWYAFTPATSGSYTASVESASFSAMVAVYTGDSVGDLNQVGCSSFSAFLLTFPAQAGVTHYIQVGGFFNDGSPFQMSLDLAPLPQADMCFSSDQPSTLDTVQFNDCSYDPGRVDFASFGWNFGDGSTSTEQAPTHRYLVDGDYMVQHSVTTFDGRTGTTSHLFRVRTHDVSIVSLSAPKSANVGQTKAVSLALRNTRYPETVTISIYRSVAGGSFELISTSQQFLPVRSGNRTTPFNFNYTFSPQDAQAGKVTFKAIVSIPDWNDAFPGDNEAISTPPTTVRR